MVKIAGDEKFISLWNQINKIIHKDANFSLINNDFPINRNQLKEYISNIKSLTIK